MAELLLLSPRPCQVIQRQFLALVLDRPLFVDQQVFLGQRLFVQRLKTSGIGQRLQQSMNLGQWRDAGLIIVLIVIVVMTLDFASAKVREKIV